MSKNTIPDGKTLPERDFHLRMHLTHKVNGTYLTEFFGWLVNIFIT